MARRIWKIAYFIWITICVIPYMVNPPNTVFRIWYTVCGVFNMFSMIKFYTKTLSSKFCYQRLHVLAHPVQQQTLPIHSCS